MAHRYGVYDPPYNDGLNYRGTFTDDRAEARAAGDAALGEAASPGWSIPGGPIHDDDKPDPREYM